jgi:CheY-like chemotaxis protein
MNNILIVDDSPTVRSTIEWALTDQGYHVSIAQDGLEALAVLQQRQPDLLLLDLFLPFVNGIQICEFIRNHLGWKSMPIIIISGQASKADINRALNAGASNYLLKPIHDVALMETLRTYLPSETLMAGAAINSSGGAL